MVKRDFQIPMLTGMSGRLGAAGFLSFVDDDMVSESTIRARPKSQICVEARTSAW